MNKFFCFIAICSLSAQVQATANYTYSEETQLGNLSIDTVEVEGEPRYKDVELELNFKEPTAGDFRVQRASEVEETEPVEIVIDKLPPSAEPISLDGASVETFIDRQKILDTISLYSHMLSGKNAEGLANQFTEDGILQIRSMAGVTRVSWETREKIRTIHEGRFTEGGDLASTEARYFQTNTVFTELTDTTAKAQTMFVGTHIDHGVPGPYVVITGFYVDEFEKVDGKWLIKKRITQLDM